jgi:methyltransferase-like protein
MDFVRNRLFRQTLLCHRRLRPTRGLNPAFMHGLMLSSRAVTEPAPPGLAPGHVAVFHKDQQRADVALPGSKAAFALLMEAWPRAVAVDELCTTALERAAPFLTETSIDEARGGMMADLFKAVMYGMVRLHTEQLSCTNHLSDTPRAHALAAYQAGIGNIVVNAHHEMVKLEPIGVEVVRLADGRRSKPELLEALAGRVNSGALPIVVDNQQEMTEPKIRRRLECELQLTLASLTRSAVMVG